MTTVSPVGAAQTLLGQAVPLSVAATVPFAPAEAVIVWVVAAKLAVKVWVPVVTSTEQVVLVVVTHVPPLQPVNV
jgi:hypothetical protein